jgi:hypothetical protein
MVVLIFPSIADLLFILLLFSMTLGSLAPRLLNDSDVGWHIRNGQLMLRTGSVTRVDPFSSSMAGKAWYAWEWLFDLAVGGIHELAGLNGVVFFAAFIIALTFALAFKLALRLGGSVTVTLVLIVLAFCASIIHLFARPHIVSWVFAVLWFQLLDSAEFESHIGTIPVKRPLLLPLLMLLWVNLHGGFVLGFVLLGIYLLNAAIAYAPAPQQRPRAAAWLKMLSVTTLLCAAASFINPYGYKLHVHVYRYLTDRWLMDHVDEFRSPNFHGAAERCFLVLVILTLLAIAAARPKPRLSHLLVVVFAMYSGFYASRNLPVASLLLVLIVAPLLCRAITAGASDQSLPGVIRAVFRRWEGFDSRMSLLESRLRWHLWPGIAVLLVALVCANGGRLGQRQFMNAHFDAKRFPVQAAGFIAQRNISDPIFAPDAWGGYLIYRLYPRTRVYVDDRHDLYGDNFLKNYLEIMRVTPQWRVSLNATGVNWVLLPEESPAANILKEDPAWSTIYQDSVAILFEKKQTMPDR